MYTLTELLIARAKITALTILKQDYLLQKQEF